MVSSGAASRRSDEELRSLSPIAAGQKCDANDCDDAKHEECGGGGEKRQGNSLGTQEERRVFLNGHTSGWGGCLKDFFGEMFSVHGSVVARNSR